jgi:hypothetical protein
VRKCRPNGIEAGNPGDELLGERWHSLERLLLFGRESSTFLQFVESGRGERDEADLAQHRGHFG